MKRHQEILVVALFLIVFVLLELVEAPVTLTAIYVALFGGWLLLFQPIHTEKGSVNGLSLLVGKPVPVFARNSSDSYVDQIDPRATQVARLLIGMVVVVAIGALLASAMNS